MHFIKEIISSRANETVKMFSSLQNKKGREENRLFIAEGVKLTDEAISCGLPVAYCIISEKRSSELIPKYREALSNLKFCDTTVMTVTDSVFEKISTEKAPQGVISVIKYLDFFDNMDIIYKEDFFKQPYEKAVILSSVRDPSNLGAIVRSAAAFGVRRLILSEDCADIYNPKTVRSAMGSLFRINISFCSDLVGFISRCRSFGRRVLSAELNPEALRLGKGVLNQHDLVVIGNEGHGVSPEVSRVCDGAVYIPITSNAESLNASVAAAILMWEQFN